MFFTEIIILAVGLLLGFLLDRFSIYKLKKLAERTPWKGDDIIIKALEGKTFWLILLLSIYFVLTITTNIPNANLLKKIVLVTILLFVYYLLLLWFRKCLLAGQMFIFQKSLRL